MNKIITPDTITPQPSWYPWVMLPARTILFAVFQALFALGFLLTGSVNAWDQSAAWWPFSVTFTNLICVVLLVNFFRAEGKHFWGLFRFESRFIKSDLLALLGILFVSAPVAFLPNMLLASALFGDTTTALNLFIRHLPIGAAYTGFILFPVTQGMAELATYFLYVEPRIEAQVGKTWLAVSLSALLLGIQHVAVPLLFNGSFILWRLLMFIPFAFLMGIVLRWRPRLLPYLAIVHILMDMATAAMLLTA